MFLTVLLFQGLVSFVYGQCTSQTRPLRLSNTSGTIFHPDLYEYGFNNYNEYNYNEYNYKYSNNQKCTWSFDCESSDILLLKFVYLSTGLQSVQCPNDYVVLPNGMTICGSSKPKNCYAFASKRAMLGGCTKSLPQCGFDTQIYAIDKWPPTIQFRSNRRNTYRGFAINYTIIKCSQEMVNNETVKPDGNEKEDEDLRIMEEAQSLARKHLTAFTATSIISGFLLVIALALILLYRREKKKVRVLKRRMANSDSLTPPSAATQTKKQPHSSLASTSSGFPDYVNSPPPDSGLDEYGYVQPNEFGKSQCPLPLASRPVYVEFN